MKNRILALLAALVLAPSSFAEEASQPAESQASEAAQDAPREEPPLRLFSFLTNIPGDYVAVGKSLFSRSTLEPFLWVVGSTAVLVKYDYELWKPLSDEHAKRGFVFDASELGWNVGKGGFQFAIAGSFLAYGAAFSSHRALRTASQILEVVIATGITTQVLKRITGRESPNVAIEPRTGKWQFFPNPAKYQRRISAYDAFPSGHIATSLATARVIALNYPEHTWIPYVGYSVVAFVGVSMVATNGHWWSDYPLSILLAHHFSKAVTRNNSNLPRERETAWQLDPFVPVPGATGLLLSRRF